MGKLLYICNEIRKSTLRIRLSTAPFRRGLSFVYFDVIVIFASFLKLYG